VILVLLRRLPRDPHGALQVA